jgi:hypothetical protein
MSQHPSTSAAAASVLEIFKACIKNGEEFKAICEKDATAAMKANPMLKHLLDKTKEDVKAIETLASKIGSLKTNNLQSLKSELNDVITRLDAMSIENVSKIKEAVAASNTSKLQKKIAANDETLNKLSEDASIRNLAQVLLDQNKKIVECLKFAHSLLPKFFGTREDDKGQRGDKKKKLFIIGDDFNKMSSYSDDQLESIGQVTIHCDGEASKMSSAHGHVPEYPSVLNGFLQEGNGQKVEVVLRLREQLSFNLIDFSREDSKMSATISIPGEVEEKIELVEINLSQQGPELMAVVQNDAGDVDEVRVQLVPISPDKSVHGRILEFQKVTPDSDENLEDIHMDLIESSLMNSTMIRPPAPHYATPLRKAPQPREHDAAALYGTGKRRSPKLARGLIDSVNDSVQMERSIREVQEIFAPAIEQIVENATKRLVNQIVHENDMNLSDVSEIKYADVSSGSGGSQQRSMNYSFGADLNDISEIKYANITGASNRSGQSPLHMSMRSPARERPLMVRQQMINRSPVEKLVDISGGSFGSPGAQRQSPRAQQFTPPRQQQYTSMRASPLSQSPGIAEGILINLSPNTPAVRGMDNFGGDLIDVSQTQSLKNTTMPQRHINFSPVRVQRRQAAGGLNRSMPMR